MMQDMSGMCVCVGARARLGRAQKKQKYNDEVHVRACISCVQVDVCVCARASVFAYAHECVTWCLLWGLYGPLSV